MSASGLITVMLPRTNDSDQNFREGSDMAYPSPQPKLKLSRLRDIGWKLWDPIGLLPQDGKWDDEANRSFADEYDRYLVSAASQLRKGASHQQVAEYLCEIEANHMGLGGNPSARLRALAVVEAISADDAIWTYPGEDIGPD